MVFGTPTGVYDSEKAARLLHDVGDESVSIATKSLLNRGVLSKRIRDPKKPAPGRMLKISEV
jgi:transcription factor C subunit 3